MRSKKPIKKTEIKSSSVNVISKQSQGKDWYYALLFASLLITFLVYSNSFQGEFTNWDDNAYVTENPDMRVLDSERIIQIFTRYEMSNYHPLVMLSYNILYSLYGDNPTPYHVFNLFFHLLNTLLIFVFIYLFFNKRLFGAFIGSLLFGIHPLHVESVAWISGTKDMLYGFFYISGLISYLYYKDRGKNKYLYLTFILFLLSCMSKAMAVSFPIVLILIDLYRSFKFNKELILNKIPFLVVSLFFGIIAIFAQQSSEAMGKITTDNFFQNFLIASHGVWFYIYKMFYPLELSAFYPYPDIDKGGMPFKFWVSPLVVLVLLGFLWHKYRRGNLILAFGFLFYLVNIAQVLQLLPVGSAIAADRYFYISSIGLFLIVAYYSNYYFDSHKVWVVSVGLILILYFSITAKDRVNIWNNSLALWEDVLSKYPDYPGAAVAYNNCGMVYRRMEENDKAFENVSRALRLDPHYGLAHKNMGGLYGKTGNYDKALEHLLLAEKYSPKDGGVYNNLGNVYAIKGNYIKAEEYFSKAIELNPQDEGSINNLGNLYIQKRDYKGAIKYYKMSMQLNPNYADAYFNLGTLYIETRDIDSASYYLNIAEKMGNSKATELLNRIRH